MRLSRPLNELALLILFILLGIFALQTIMGIARGEGALGGWNWILSKFFGATPVTSSGTKTKATN